MPPKKFAHVVGEDLKAVKDMVPQLKTEGFQRWHSAMQTVSDSLEWGSDLMDLTAEYNFETEDDQMSLCDGEVPHLGDCFGQVVDLRET